MTRSLPLLAALLVLAGSACAHAAPPAPAGGTAVQSGAKPGEPEPPPSAPVPRAAVLEEVTGTVGSVDLRAHTLTVRAAGGPVTLSLDRNTMVYTPAGLGTVLDLVPGAEVRAGRNAELLAYWVQVRRATRSEPSPAPGQGTGPGGGTTAPPERGGPGGGTPPSPSPSPVAPGSGPGARP